MKLVELEPRWVHPNIFIFLCPHCRQVLLSCKNVQMNRAEQAAIFRKEFGDGWGDLVIATEPECAWSISGSVPIDKKAAFVMDLTVTPSIDASKSGHWHGHITQGEIA